MRTLLILLPGWVDDQGVKLSAKNYRVLSPIMNFTADADIGFLLKMIKAKLASDTEDIANKTSPAH